MEPVNLKLKALREEANPRLTVRAMADALGMPPSTYAAYEDRNKFKKPHLPLSLVKRIAPILEDHGVDTGRVMELAGLEAQSEQLLIRTSSPSSPDELAKELGFALIPELELGYSMGGGAVFNDYRHVGVVPFVRDWLRGLMRGTFADLFVARGEGDSMQPTLLDGDIVLIDTAQKDISRQDAIWALSYGDLGMIKRVRRLPDGTYSLNSDNPAISSIHAVDGEMHVVGRVIWIGRRM